MLTKLDSKPVVGGVRRKLGVTDVRGVIRIGQMRDRVDGSMMGSVRHATNYIMDAR